MWTQSRNTKEKIVSVDRPELNIEQRKYVHTKT